MGADTNELLRAVAHAPAPALNALPQQLVAPPRGAQLGNFLLGEKLGEGGMGVVYRALDQRLGREVALKLLPAHLAADPTRRARFFREARMAATVMHPNVATVFELGETNPPFIALELVLGESMRARIERGFVGAAEAERLALAIASGLAAAHERGVIHRDLKPENVMIAADGTPKLVDFGLARGASTAEQRSTVSAAHTKSGWVLGTPRYMAPEQAAGGEVDARVDVYAFGLLLVDLANGVGLDAATPAFRRAEAARAVVATTLPKLAAIAERCLAFSPDGRYADARALVTALREAASPATLSPS
jgi:serine/threonine protein kinase